MNTHGQLRGTALAIAVFLLLAATGCGKPGGDGDDKTRPLVWAGDAEGGAPYVFPDPDPKNPRKHKGFEVDIADALEKELGREVKFKQYSFDKLVEGVERGDFDFAMSGLEITPDREKVARFSRPYYIYRQQLVIRADDARFKGVADLEGKPEITVATLANTAASRYLEKKQIKTKTYTDQINPYEELANARGVDAVLLDWPIALYVVQKNPELNSKLKFVGDRVEPGHYAIAFSKKDEALAKECDGALERLIQKGELKRILEKWEIWNDEQLQLATAPAKK